MKKNPVITVALILLAIVGVSVFAAANNQDGDRMDDMNMNSSTDSEVSVMPNKKSADYNMMATVSGEDFDRLFLANMIAHHQGAVDMANLALKSAKHQEVKDLAKAIVSTQTTEIANMVSWQKTWGYSASSGTGMIDHTAMSMDDTNAGMMNALNNKTGDDFDKAFLTQMILHHQSAIDMAASGTNANHQEVKDLTTAIISAQTKEIKQMKQWQKNWGY